jgi:hypothetical protein
MADALHRLDRKCLRRSRSRRGPAFRLFRVAHNPHDVQERHLRQAGFLGCG